MSNPAFLPFRPQVLARRTDPETSHLAANKARGLRHEHSTLILYALKGGDSLTAEQIGDRVGLTSVQVCRRLRELADAELIEQDGQGKQRNGRTARRWRRR